MIEEAVTYPMEGDDAPKTLLIGGAIYLASGVIGFFASILAIIPLIGIILGPLGALVAVIPTLLVGGYSVSVCRSVMAGAEEPPSFEDWGRLLKDGLKVAAIGLLYALPVVVLGVLALVVFLTISFIFGSYSDITGLASLLISTLGSLVAAVYLLAMGYVMPAAIVNLARTDRVSSAWDVGTLRAVATNVEYAKAWAVGLLVLLIANVVGSSLTVLLVGFLVFFYGQVVAMYLYANGAMDVLGTTPSGPTDDDAPSSDTTDEPGGGAGSGRDAGRGTDEGRDAGGRSGEGGRDRSGRTGGRRSGEDGRDTGGRRSGEDGRDTGGRRSAGSDRRTGDDGRSAGGRSGREIADESGADTADEGGADTADEQDLEDDDEGFDIDDGAGAEDGTAIDDGADADDGAGAEDAGAAEDRDLEDVTGIGPTTADSLRMAGYDSVADLRAATRSELADIEGIGPAKADRIKDDVDEQ